jgi:hypothetical protein
MSHALLLPNTFQYIQALKKVGFEEVQAEKIVETINSVDVSSFATKKDIADLESRMDLKFAQLESRLITTISALLIGQSAIIVGLVQYLK